MWNFTSSCHIYVTPMHTKPGIKERMLADMRDSAKELMAKPKEKLDGRVRILDGAAAFKSFAGIFHYFTLLHFLHVRLPSTGCRSPYRTRDWYKR